MIRFLLLLTGIMIGLTSLSQALRPVDDQSSVKFKIKNFGFNVNGSFTGLQGTINFNPDNPGLSNMDVTVDPKTVNTGIDLRDSHLRKPEYFDVKKYPGIRFVSTKITPSSKSGTLFMFGKLTIKNVTR
jgi:polyisoprenoid-binding protein YceI